MKELQMFLEGNGITHKQALLRTAYLLSESSDETIAALYRIPEMRAQIDEVHTLLEKDEEFIRASTKLMEAAPQWLARGAQAVAKALPTVGSVAGGIGGAALGSALGGVGAIAGGVGGRMGGAKLGQMAGNKLNNWANKQLSPQTQPTATGTKQLSWGDLLTAAKNNNAAALDYLRKLAGSEQYGANIRQWAKQNGLALAESQSRASDFILVPLFEEGVTTAAFQAAITAKFQKIYQAALQKGYSPTQAQAFANENVMQARPAEAIVASMPTPQVAAPEVAQVTPESGTPLPTAEWDRLAAADREVGTPAVETPELPNGEPDFSAMLDQQIAKINQTAPLAGEAPEALSEPELTPENGSIDLGALPEPGLQIEAPLGLEEVQPLELASVVQTDPSSLASVIPHNEPLPSVPETKLPAGGHDPDDPRFQPPMDIETGANEAIQVAEGDPALGIAIAAGAVFAGLLGLSGVGAISKAIRNKQLQNTVGFEGDDAKKMVSTTCVNVLKTLQSVQKEMRPDAIEKGLATAGKLFYMANGQWRQLKDFASLKTAAKDLPSITAFKLGPAA